MDAAEPSPFQRAWAWSDLAVTTTPGHSPSERNAIFSLRQLLHILAALTR